MRWVTVATFEHPHQAHLAKTLLDASGISTALFDEHIVDAHPFYSAAVGGVKLSVPEAEAVRAVELLGDVEKVGSDALREARRGWWLVVVLFGGPLAILLAGGFALADRFLGRD